MISYLKGKWDAFKVWISGWKTKATAIVILVLNFWDSVAPSFDLGQIISDGKVRAWVTAGLAVLAYYFRAIAQTVK